MTDARRYLRGSFGPALFILAAIGVALMPRVMGEFRLLQFTLVALYAIALLGLNILTGYSGQISLGHGALVGVGAYVTTLVSLGRPGLVELGHSPPDWLPLGDGMRPVLTIAIAAGLTGLLGLLIGIPALRLGGISLALATLALAVSFPILMKRFDTVTGGGGGLNLKQSVTPFGLDISTRHWLFYEAWATAGILFVAAWLITRGRIGRAWRAIRDGEVAATSSGVNPALYKVLAFGVSAAFAGAAGSLLAIETAYVNPDTFPVSISILLLASAVIGGLGSLAGAILGALLYVFLPIYSQNPPIFDVEFADQAPGVVFGVFLIVIMLLMPGGVAHFVRALVGVARTGRFRRRSRTSELA